ncbi:MAG: ChbG/HpnK family deacetylase [Culicoidibacterales bacterium]
MHLLFNADDFGLSPSVNHGILEAFHHGVVRSTTLMTNLGSTTTHAISLAHATPDLDVGLHFNMFIGPSLTGPIEGCTDNNGNFFKWIHTPTDKLPTIDFVALQYELQTQLQFAFDHGLKLSHIDSHRHGHIHPELFPFFGELAERYQLKLRNFNTPVAFKHLTVTDSFSADFFDQNVSLDSLKTLIRQAQGASIEIMCHPAYSDEILLQRSSYTNQREKELKILTHPQLLSWIKAHHHQLINFRD